MSGKHGPVIDLSAMQTPALSPAKPERHAASTQGAGALAGQSGSQSGRQHGHAWRCVSTSIVRSSLFTNATGLRSDYVPPFEALPFACTEPASCSRRSLTWACVQRPAAAIGPLACPTAGLCSTLYALGSSCQRDQARELV